MIHLLVHLELENQVFPIIVLDLLVTLMILLLVVLVVNYRLPINYVQRVKRRAHVVHIFFAVRGAIGQRRAFHKGFVQLGQHRHHTVDDHKQQREEQREPESLGPHV